MSNQKTEAKILSNYLIKNAFDNEVEERYKLALLNLSLENSCPPNDVKITHKAIQNTFLLPLLDAGFGILKPNHLLRKKLIVMTGILETSKRTGSYFLNKKNSNYSFMKLIFAGTKSLLYTVTGIILIIIFRWK